MKQGKHVKLDSPFKDAWFKPWGGTASPKPQDTNKGNKGKKNSSKSSY